jgi:hypothetical protein
MGKGSGLAIFALLIGFGGLGLGLYSVFILPDTIIAQTTNNSEIIQIWTKEQPAVYYTTGSYVEVPDMDLTITVNSGETVVILFNGQFYGTPGILLGGIRFMRDNVEIPNSRRDFNIETTGGILMGNSITAHILIDSLAAGTYEIELQAYGNGGSDRLDDGVLIIYTFN